MFKSYAITAIRNLLKHKTYSTLNIAGLAVGVACCVLILLYVENEFRYDRHFDNADRIYRLNAEYRIGNKVDQYANVPRPVGPTLHQEFPEVLEFARTRLYSGLSTDPVLISNRQSPDRAIEEQMVFWADSTFFGVFSHTFVRGAAQHALSKKNTAVITQSVATRIFGDEDPLNREISLNRQQHFAITGVIQDPPRTSHMNFEVLLSWSTFHSESDLTRWIGGHVYTYLLFPENPDIAGFQQKLPQFYESFTQEPFKRIDADFRLLLQPLKEIHLHSRLQWEIRENGSLTHVYLFLAIAGFILAIACINYVNLATARATARALEVGIRKVFGADRGRLIKQFLVESAITTALALAIGLVLVRLLLPTFIEFAGRDLSFQRLLSAHWLAVLAAIAAMVGILSGLYPAFYLSRFRPVKALSEKVAAKSRRSILRQTLVVAQFVISIVIIAGTGVMRDQLNYTRAKDLGFAKDNIVAVNLTPAITASQIPGIKQELLQHPAILRAATSYDAIGTDLNHTASEIEAEDGSMQQQTFQFMQIDSDFLPLMQMKLLAGRNFSREIVTDKTESVMVNEAAVRKFGWRTPVGKKIRFSDEEVLHVVGVVSVFHVASLHREIEPVVLLMPEEEGGKLYLRLSGANLPETLAFIEERWRHYDKTMPIRYSFLDQSFYALHASDERLGKIFGYFATVAIIISCLGLLGLVSFSTEQRRKEIGVRKVLGAKVVSLLLLIWKEFMLLVLIANAVAFPIAYFGMSRWLQDFAYRVDIAWETFVIAGGLICLVALLTMSYQALRAATANPVTALRYE